MSATDRRASWGCTGGFWVWGVGWRWGRLSQRSPGINLPLPALIAAKRPDGNTLQTPGGWNKPAAAWSSVSRLHHLTFGCQKTPSFIFSLVFLFNNPEQLANIVLTLTHFNYTFILFKGHPVRFVGFPFPVVNNYLMCM